jgi:hypothetical protein
MAVVLQEGDAPAGGWARLNAPSPSATLIARADAGRGQHFGGKVTALRIDAEGQVLAHVGQSEGQHVEAALVAGQLAVEEVTVAGVEGHGGDGCGSADLLELVAHCYFGKSGSARHHCFNDCPLGTPV